MMTAPPLTHLHMYAKCSQWVQSLYRRAHAYVRAHVILCAASITQCAFRSGATTRGAGCIAAIPERDVARIWVNHLCTNNA